MNSLLIFSENTSPRLDYVCRLLFTDHLGLAFSITTDKEHFKTATGPKLNYSTSSLPCPLRIEASTLLFETGIKKQDIKIAAYKGLNVPFAREQGDFPFDIFAAVFFFVSRYEEYLPFEPNQYGQFKAADSLAHQLGILEKPVVEIWIHELAKELLRHYPGLQVKQKTFTAIFTYDIDVAYAYKGRSLLQQMGHIVKDAATLQFKKLARRLKVLLQKAADPFDTYDHIEETAGRYKHPVIFFLLVGPRNTYNRNLAPYSKSMQQLVQKLGRLFPIGIHPSYYTSNNLLQLQHEKLLLETSASKKITQSRQHYLRLEFPETYSNLLKAGITDDYTLGFAELPGFRAGTCNPFRFYNLLTETGTELMIHPNTYMEGTFAEDLQLHPAATQERMEILIDEVKKVNGTFICIWHNHSISDEGNWKGMKAVHDHTAAYAATGRP